jgi:hypothetical protein
MVRLHFFSTILLLAVISCHTTARVADRNNPGPGIQAKNTNTVLTCKLMPDELKVRKEKVLLSLKEKVLERRELPNGYAFRFPGDDVMIDELIEFVKTERECCDFFVFNLSISGDKSEAWLALTGVKGAKDFVTEELGL